MIERPELERREAEPKRPRGVLLPILVIGGVALVVAVGTSLFAFGMFVPIIAAIFLLAVFHYVIWGWWLGGMIRQETETDIDELDKPEPSDRSSGR